MQWGDFSHPLTYSLAGAPHYSNQFWSLYFIRRLLIQLEAAKNAKAAPAGGKSPAKTPAGTGNTVTYELHSRPEQDKFSQAAKVNAGSACSLEIASTLHSIMTGAVSVDGYDPMSV